MTMLCSMPMAACAAPAPALMEDCMGGMAMSCEFETLDAVNSYKQSKTVQAKQHLTSVAQKLSGGIKKKECKSESRSKCCSRSPPSSPRKGKATAARVSRGSEFDTWKGLTVKAPKRNKEEHVTVTVVIYNTVAGGVPHEEDVARAVEDMEELYRQCAWSGKLADAGVDFMKQELTVADMMKIEDKVVTQPYVPPSTGVVGFDAFPMDEDEVEAVPVRQNEAAPT